MGRREVGMRGQGISEVQKADCAAIVSLVRSRGTAQRDLGDVPLEYGCRGCKAGSGAADTSLSASAGKAFITVNWRREWHFLGSMRHRTSVSTASPIF